MCVRVFVFPRVYFSFPSPRRKRFFNKKKTNENLLKKKQTNKNPAIGFVDVDRNAEYFVVFFNFFFFF
jgi:hypothetical protein